METMFGVGLMLGPFLGGVLYELNGFYLPFVVCGAGLAVCPLLGVLCISRSSGSPKVLCQQKTFLLINLQLDPVSIL